LHIVGLVSNSPLIGGIRVLYSKALYMPTDNLT
jgi:hypothetical protein